MKDIDKLLLNTSWTRSGKQQHHPIIGVIDTISARGPRLKTDTNKFQRIVWGELGFSWVPTDKSSERKYLLWKDALRIESLDKKLEKLHELQEVIELAENGVVTMETPEVAVKECHGAWHRHAGKYELIPLNQFSIATRGPNTGQLASVCDDCKAKHKQLPAVKRQIKYAPPVPVKIDPVIETSEGSTYRWKVTVIQVTEHFVQGRDFLDAAAQLAGLGEITKVEKI